jgi:NAD(P)-dependent dehydrogenase (short-subunit alcohol dehydrogenase family)
VSVETEEETVQHELQDKVAIVTGAAGGIGAAYARALAGAGASVAIADVDGEGAAAVAGSLAHEGFTALHVPVDITSPAHTKWMAQAVCDSFGGIDILVNNAALMAGIPRAPLHEFDLVWWDRIMRVNVTGALLCTQACVPSMIERGGGKIVNQSSMGAFYNWGPYGISKLALIGLTYGLAKELGPFNINVNAIAPGMITSEAGLGLVPIGSPAREANEARAAMSVTGSPEDLCGALLFLTSAASDYMTGQCLNVDGGFIFRL